MRALIPFLFLLAAAAPARAADELVAPVPGAVSPSAYGGWVVYSTPVADRTWRLMAFHDGKVEPVGVADRGAAFDVDVGPDAAGRPTAVYSRCRDETSPSPSTGCDVYAARLGGGRERRLAVSSRRHSEFAPSIWRRSIAFGRRSPGQRKADVMLSRPGRKLKRLGAGTLAKCMDECDRPSTARPLAIDLGPRAVGYLWELDGGSVIGTGYGLEMRIARLDGSRAKLASSGYFGGACGFEQPLSPNVVGTDLLYGHARGGECEESFESVRRFTLRRARRFEAELPDDSSISLARDAAGGALYTVKDGQLLRRHDLEFRRIEGGEANPPTY